MENLCENLDKKMSVCNVVSNEIQNNIKYIIDPLENG